MHTKCQALEHTKYFIKSLIKTYIYLSNIIKLKHTYM